MYAPTHFSGIFVGNVEHSTSQKYLRVRRECEKENNDKR